MVEKKASKTSNGRLEREKRVVRLMIGLYCRHKLRMKVMPDDYVALCDYACRRLDRCRYGDRKHACRRCRTHCYAPQQRAMIRAVMRWAGPRMLIYAPLAAIRHWLHR